jgi:glycosyltransferase involved in cell wall biosynthesis
MINITLAILAKNEAHCIADAIYSAKAYVNEIMIINDHSTDDTEAICTMAGASRIVELPFNVSDMGFAKAANWMIDTAKHDWILILDADELLSTDGSLFHTLTRSPGKEVWALPRRKWNKYPTSRMEYEAYPDWQVRFFKRNEKDRFIGEMHVRYQCEQINYAYRGPHIEHLQSENRTEQKLAQRNILYPDLALRQGVIIVGGDVLRTTV